MVTKTIILIINVIKFYYKFIYISYYIYCNSNYNNIITYTYTISK